MKKIFSFQPTIKKEGLDYLLNSLKGILEKSTVQKNEENPNENETSKIINLLMKLILTMMKDKHPLISIKTIDLFQNMLENINSFSSNKKLANNLSYDYKITDKILGKIKEKIGDPNVKIRTKAVDLYCLLLRQNLCDYNNLLSELLQDEIEPVDTKKIAKSSKTIVGKLSIFDNVFDEIQNAINDKRTDLNTFPFNSILKYVIENISNSKSEIRKLARRILVKMYTAFGFKKIEPMIKKIDDRELVKLVELMPEVKETLKTMQQQNLYENSIMLMKLQQQNNSQVLQNNKSLLARKSLDKKKSENKGSNMNLVKQNKSLEKESKRNAKINKKDKENNDELINLNINSKKLKDSEAGSGNNNIGEFDTNVIKRLKNEQLSNLNISLNSNGNNNNPKDAKNKEKNKTKKLICSYCGKSDDTFITPKHLEIHKLNDCPLFINCAKCNKNIEVRLLNNHLLTDCAKKSESKLCKRCKEAIDVKNYEEHLKMNNCNPAKNLNSSNRCPICHKDIPPYDKGFVQHLVNDKCPNQKRNNE